MTNRESAQQAHLFGAVNLHAGEDQAIRLAPAEKVGGLHLQYRICVISKYSCLLFQARCQMAAAPWLPEPRLAQVPDKRGTCRVDCGHERGTNGALLAPRAIVNLPRGIYVNHPWPGGVDKCVEVQIC